MRKGARTILLAALALFCCGFVVTTPESRRVLKKELAMWNREVARQFDRKALHDFLADTVAHHPTVAGVALSPETVGTRFEARKGRFYWTDGQWLLTVPNPQSTAFELRMLTKQGWIIFQCERTEKSRFSLLNIRHDPGIPLCPPPYAFGPDL